MFFSIYVDTDNVIDITAKLRNGFGNESLKPVLSLLPKQKIFQLVKNYAEFIL